MKIKIKLENPKYCNGCPCVHDWYMGEQGMFCYHYKTKLKIVTAKETYSNGVFIFSKLKRLKKCVKDNGK